MSQADTSGPADAIGSESDRLAEFTLKIRGRKRQGFVGALRPDCKSIAGLYVRLGDFQAG